ncbi:hypothetical protein A2482_02635 [Candidatus Falkowbacteria bacterium RIFOXYC2_FULL_48_21]|uniref:DUF5666 domain-containing protein n=1 Tax=Candidatus Falkowbacteria bacterium RIFOXYC2_FULL_48_21 TaxID=1798005 RepID=A0A1F5TBJ4_9BACT|nr:MAG: hypothetical protein A2482_02635 [Candidatus Falkowbacteria bacterium RIFOXYC2_FULL_48_21]
MDFNKIFQSTAFKVTLLAIGGIIILLFVFEIGTFAGYHKAKFSCRWDKNYMQNFTGPHKGLMNDFGKEFKGAKFMNAHGVSGTIIKLDGDTFVLKGTDGVEKIILLTAKTVINRFRETINSTDLQVDDNMVIIGSPNDAGQIEAKLIRILPTTPPTKPPNDSTVPVIPPETTVK